ncbi:MAG: hypothetical protein KGZ59_10195 [Chitinophagaceae bacterium]|nr:hypothetical protein [Chitinophagaceae bacterium]
MSTFKAAFKAFSFNKISDIFFFFFILLVYNLFFTFDILTILNSNKIFLFKKFYFLFFFCNYNDLVFMFLILCSFVKSAQIGFHFWLPDSMEAPVPASSLIHSATLVSAGVFLLLRFNIFLETSIVLVSIVGFFGSTTALYGAVVSAHQIDTKKILAYSTISHCGFLMVLIVSFRVEFLLLYLYVHGFFKASIFMCVGNINRFSQNNQDIRRMGLFVKHLIFEFFFCFIGLINLCGLPFSFGFFIKHYLFLSFELNYLIFLFIFFNCLIAAFFGLLYSYKILYNVFFDFKKFFKNLIIFNLSFKSKFFSNSNYSAILSIMLIFFLSFFVNFFLFFVFLYDTNIFDFFDFYLVKFFCFFFNFFFFNFFFFNYFFLLFFFIIFFYY